MKPLYSDILERLGDPLWWDQRGVPRYEPFHPSMVGIDADVVVLATIQCQFCGHPFRVAIEIDHWDHPRIVATAWNDGERVVEALQRESVGYGDPPRLLTPCCEAGVTATSEIHGIHEVWVFGMRDKVTKWYKVEGWEFDPASKTRRSNRVQKL